MTLVSLLLILPAAYADRHVAVDGVDTGNDCADVATPCGTIAHGAAMARRGETVHIGPGTYVTDEAIPVGNGVSLHGAGADLVHLEGAGFLKYNRPVAGQTVRDLTLATDTFAVQLLRGGDLDLIDVDVSLPLGSGERHVPILTSCSDESDITVTGGMWMFYWDIVFQSPYSLANPHIPADGDPWDWCAGLKLSVIDATLVGTSIVGGGPERMTADYLELEMDGVDIRSLWLLGYIEVGRADIQIRNTSFMGFFDSRIITTGPVPPSILLDNVQDRRGGGGTLLVDPLGSDQAGILSLSNVEVDMGIDAYNMDVNIADSSIGHSDGYVIEAYDSAVTIENTTVWGGARVQGYGPEPSHVSIIDSQLLEAPYGGYGELVLLGDLVVQLDSTQLQYLYDEAARIPSRLDVEMRDVVVGVVGLWTSDTETSVYSLVVQDSVVGDTVDLYGESVHLRAEGTDLGTLNMQGELSLTADIETSEMTGAQFRGGQQVDLTLHGNVFRSGFSLPAIAGTTPVGVVTGSRNAFIHGDPTQPDIDNTGNTGVDVNLGPTWLSTDDLALASDRIRDQQDDPTLTPVRYTLLSSTLDFVATTQLQGAGGGLIQLTAVPGSPPFVNSDGRFSVEAFVGGMPLEDVAVTADGTILTGRMPAMAPGTYDVEVTQGADGTPIASGTLVAGVTVVDTPEPILELDALPMVLGMRSAAQVRHAQPNRLVYLVLSAQSDLPAACPGALGGSCSALPGGADVVLSAMANADGVADFNVPVPATLSGPGMILQAFELQAGTSSPAWTAPWLNATDDTDGDGLDNASELAASTDALDPDTDGDGCLDGEDAAPLRRSPHLFTTRSDCP